MKTSNLIDYFHFVRAHRISAALLFLLSGFFLVLPYFYDYIITPPPPTDFSETEALVAAILDSTEANKLKTFPKKYYPAKERESFSNEKRKPKKDFRNRLSETNMEPFDPNTISQNELLKFGFSEKVATTLANFRTKGGKFYKKEDLKKIYGITDNDYKILEPHITIEKPKNKFSETKKHTTPPTEKKKTAAIKIDANKASEEEWQQLKGIGPYYAKKIVNFRDKLGGFSSIEQIGTTYGLKDSTFQVIKPFLELSPVFSKIKINTASAEQLTAHPYIKRKAAAVVIKFRSNHGNFSSLEDFKKTAVFSKEELERLAPYLDFSN